MKVDLLKAWAEANRSSNININKAATTGSVPRKLWRLPEVGSKGGARVRTANRELARYQVRLNNYLIAEDWKSFWSLALYLVNSSWSMRLLALHRIRPSWIREFDLDFLVKAIHRSYGNKPITASIRRIYIPKPNGKLRPLGIPPWGSRIYFGMWSIIFSLIGSHLELSNQWAYLPGKSISGCWKNIQSTLVRRSSLPERTMIYEYDLKGFFDGLSHNLILSMMEEYLQMPNEVLNLFSVILRIPVDDNGIKIPTTAGVPQGLAISPLISILTLEYSGFMAEIIGCERFQFSDDGLIIGNVSTILGVDEILRNRCLGGLSLAEDKSRYIDPTHEIWKFLGIESHPNGDLY